MSSDRVYRWRLLLEEYGPEIIYIKGIDNTVADAISRLLFSKPTQTPMGAGGEAILDDQNKMLVYS